MMKNFFMRLSLASLSLGFCIVGISEVNAQETAVKVILRNGSVLTGQASMEYDDVGFVKIGRRKVERSKINLICFADCKDAPQGNTEKDLVVFKDGQRKSGELTSFKINSGGQTQKSDEVAFDDKNYTRGEIPASAISYIKFSDHAFYSIEQALQRPRMATRLFLKSYKSRLKHLSPKLGNLTNLRELEIHCQEDLIDLPKEIGKLRKLEKLIMDNGNGCGMRIALPASIGQLKNLKVLVLDGTLGGRGLPKTIANLENLEELDLSRSVYKSIPSSIGSLRKLKRLELDFAEIVETPPFLAKLKNLKELSLLYNKGVKLDDSLASLKGLKIYLGNNSLKLAEQELLRRRFPNLVLDFENDMLDGSVNEEPAAKN
jgi:hypothetical protein